MHFVLDENVAASVSYPLLAGGHTVESVRDLLVPGSPDQLVAAVCEQKGAVLVSHDKDFHQLGARLQIGKTRFGRLSRIALRCAEPRAAERIGKALSLIESEFKLAKASHDTRMIVHLGESYIRTER